MAEMSEFARMLKQKRQEREHRLGSSDRDPVVELERNLSEKRRPLLSAENSPQKPKSDAKKARHDKLARLAQNIRAMDAADRGESLMPHDLKPIPGDMMSPNRRRSHEMIADEKENEAAEFKPKKNSKWAKLAEERQSWDNDFMDNVKENRIVAETRSSVKTTPEIVPKQLQPSSSARDMVAEALARAGKSQQTVQKIQIPNIRRIDPNHGRKEPNARIEELQNTERAQRVSDLIQGFTPKKGPSTPKQSSYPAMIEETRQPVEHRPLIGSPKKNQQPRLENKNTEKRRTEPRIDSKPKPIICENQFVQEYDELMTPNTKADLELESIKKQIEETKEALQRNKVTASADEEDCMDLSVAHNEGPMLSSTIVQRPKPLEDGEESTMEFRIDETESCNITGYKKGHSLTFVKQQFEFLPDQSSLPELKEEITIQRTPNEIRGDVKTGEYFEAGDTPNKKSKKKRRSASFATNGTVDDMVEFTAKSIQSFRRTQRVKRYEAKATAKAVFSPGEEVEKIDLNAERKRLKAEVTAQMNIIRQTSAALSVCTDVKHGKGTYAQIDGERVLLLALKRHDLANIALANLGKQFTEPTSRGRVKVGNIVLRTRYQETFESPQIKNKSHWLMATVQVGNELQATKLDLKNSEVRDAKDQKSVVIPTDFTFSNVPADFEITITIYSISVDQTERPRDRKPNSILPNKLGKLFNQKINKKEKINPALFSPGGPSAVRKSNFKPIGVAKINLKTAQKYDQFKMTNMTWDAIIQSVISTKIEPKFTDSCKEYASFITVRTGRGAYGNWVRYWAVLSKDRITFWKYPEDKEDLPAEGHISLKYVVSPIVKSANKIMTKRPNTVELYHADPKPGFRKNPNHIDGVVSDYDPNKLVRFQLSADTTESKAEWISALNQKISDLRAWERNFPSPIEDILGE